MPNRSLRLAPFLPLVLASAAGAQMPLAASTDARLAALERRVTTVERVNGVDPNAAPTPLTGGPAPLGVHVDAADAIVLDRLGDTRVTWDFGDPGSTHDTLVGFNAAHVYDRPGDYTITRTVDAPDTGRTVRTYSVTVAPDGRHAIHVSADGDDKANDGSTEQAPVRTIAKAVDLIGRNGGNAAILLRRGDRFPIDRSIELAGQDLRVADYGDAAAALPVIVADWARSPSLMMIDVRGRRAVVERVAFDVVNWPDTGSNKMAHAFNAGGQGLVVRDCEFLTIGAAVNGNGRPDGVLLQHCVATTPTSLRTYLAWVEGTDWTILDNAVPNSTREHCIRIGGGERVNLQGNRLTNLDRRPVGDGGDYAKNTLTIQKGAVAYVANNVFTGGPVSCGPLGGGDGKTHPQDRWYGLVLENNRVIGAPVQVQHGARYVTIRNNLVSRDDDMAFEIFGYDADYQRGVSDVTIAHNTAVNRGRAGTFLNCGAGGGGITLVGNYYVAPQLVQGRGASVTVKDADLSAFARIDGNRWPQSSAVGQVGGAALGADAWRQKAPGDAAVAVTSADALTSDDAGVDVSKLPPATPPTTQEAGR